MIFTKLIGTQEINETDVKMNYRQAVRAVIIHNKKILLIHSNQGDYKLPGGGVEMNENHPEALLREVAEETGYINCVMKDKIGVVIERHIDEYDDHAYFQMTSHYYLCELTDGEKVAQKLDHYESEQEFTPEWLTLDDAISQNQKVMKQFQQNRWIIRENFVLNELKNLHEAE
ncbi:MAG TPA: NUDIX domain-containing protein [Neobacillus sp.]|jgi:8-oxo-dGTP pyrophosphatase MutT (NUDIX family)